MADITPEQIQQAALTPRWSALTAIGRAAADLNNYDQALIRDPRLLVPVNVQALVVRAGDNDGEGMIRLPFRDSEAMPPLDVHDAGTPRAPGVHLLWSVPAALGNGTVTDDPAAPGDASRRRLQLPALPDRWAVLRLAVPAGAQDPLVTGWVIEADAGTVTPLADWPASRDSTQTVAGPALTPAQLNLHVGGTSWAQCYDAATGRLALYDSLADLAGATLEGDAISYLVAGWWSSTAADPLTGIGTDIAYHQRLSELGWNDVDHPSSQQSRSDAGLDRARAARTFGFDAASRYAQPAVVSSDAAARAARTSGLAGSAAPQSTAAGPLRPAMSGFLQESLTAELVPPAPTQSTLLTGRLHGVPLNGSPGSDGRPPAGALKLVLGASTPDLAAAVAASGTGLGATDQRAAERLLAGFAAGLTTGLDNSDTWSDIDDYEHTHGFGSLPGGVEGVDRFVDKPAPGTDPGSGFRPGNVVTHRVPAVTATASVLWNAIERPSAAPKLTLASASLKSRAGVFDARVNSVPPPAPQPQDQVREVNRPAPRYEFPAAPVVAVVGGGRALSAVEREEADGALMCRLSDQLSSGHAGVLAASELLGSIGSGAVPDEVLGLAREALAEDPYLSGWRARRAAGHGFVPASASARMLAESAVSFSYYAADNDRLTGLTGAPVTSAASRQRATEGLLRMSVSTGVWQHPEGVTMWGQPWRPLFCDWQVSLELGGLDGWELSGIDLDPAAGTPVATPDTISLAGRSPLVSGVAGTLAAAIGRWLTDERQRDLGGHGLADAATEADLAQLRALLASVDLLSVTLDGVREQLLGLDYDRGLVHSDVNALPDGTRRALATGLPRLLQAGRISLTSARLVDAFGRLLDLPVEAVAVPERLADGAPGVQRLRPRLTAPARWRFDLVDATSTSPDAALASIDQTDPSKQVTPIAGFLLPDHMDESLEVFATDGTPLGEVLHDPFSDAVSWEIAPGRTDVAPAAGPTEDPDPAHHRVGWIAAGLVTADATARQGTPDRAETESALSAMLRAIDTTLWTVDPFGSLGQSHIAGLVGRPIAVVAARLALDIYSDVADRAYPAPAPPDTASPVMSGRQAAYDALPGLEFEVRLGEITRSDDGLLGYFVDDDYAHFHVVDKVIAAEALPSGRCQGVLADDATPGTTPVPIDHPYVDPAGVLRIHPGQTVRLTLLMHPGGKVYLTSGVLPRVSKALARDWVDPGLSVLAPSLRCGPLLIDADKVRLPKVASFPADQLFTRRDTPATWKDDPILAATQSALLPDTAPEVQEGWVRINPNPSPPGGGGS
jgi:hypothetical protein